MFSRIRTRFTFANITMVLVVVFAMSGGAYAASKYVISSTKQIKPSVLKQLQGKPGKSGSAGPEGKTGAPGTSGKDGAPGTKGEQGAKGEQGPQGVPGVEGKEGKEGSPWTAGGTLPSEKTETGSWSIDYKIAGANEPALGSISFPIPLKSALGAANVHYVPAGLASGTGNLTSGESVIKKAEVSSGKFEAGQEITGTGIPSGTLIRHVNAGTEELQLEGLATASGTGVALTAGVPVAVAAVCKGSVAAPLASKGNLCVYDSVALKLEPNIGATISTIFLPSGNVTNGGAGTSGAMLNFTTTEPPFGITYGTWAVTAP